MKQNLLLRMAICAFICLPFNTAVAQTITTFAGGGGTLGDGGQATAAQVMGPYGICVDAAGNKYIAQDGTARVRKVTPAGIISTVAGTGTPGFTADGGQATAAQLKFPKDVATDAAGNLYIAEHGDGPTAGTGRIRKVDATTGIISTIAGGGAMILDGVAATNAAISPTRIKFNAAGTHLYLSDLRTYKVKKINMATGIITTVAGNGTNASLESHVEGAVATAYSLGQPDGIAWDAAGNLYIAQQGVYRVSVVRADGNIYTAAGTGVAGYDGDGVATTKKVYIPFGIAVDGNDNLLIAEFGNNIVRKVNLGTGMMTTLAGNTDFGESGDGGPATNAELSSPIAVTADAEGQVYICDVNGARVRVIGAPPCTTPTVNVTGGGTVCQGIASTLNATGSTSFSWAPGTGLSSTSGASVSANPSTTTTYTVTGGVGTCTSTATVTVSINPSPAVISGTLQVCKNLTTTLSSTPSGGTWSSSNANVSINSSGVATGANVGMATVTYTAGTGCFRTTTVTVNDLPTVDILGGSSVCQGSSIGLSTSVNTSYVWTPAASLSCATCQVVTASPTVATTYTVTGTNANGCSKTNTKTVTVDVISMTAGTNGTVCLGASHTMSASGATSYSWVPVAGLSSPTNATVTATPGATTTYTVTGTNGACTQTKTVTVTVNAATGAITGTAQWCKGLTTTLSCTPTGGTWSSSAPTTASVNSVSGVVTGVNGGTANISYTKAGCSSVREVTVLATPAIDGPPTVCVGLTATMSNTLTGGTWSKTADTFATIDASTGVITGLDEGVTTITYTPATGCAVTRQFTVGLPPAFTTGPWVCLDQSMQVIHPIPGGTWSSSNPARASIDPVSGVVHGITLGNFYLTYTLGTGCMRVTEMAVQTFSLDITGSMNVCQGLTTALSNESSSGTWSSSNEAVAYISMYTGTVYGLTPGTVNITYKFHSCVHSEVLTVNALPSNIAGPNELCAGADATYSSIPAGGTWASSDVSNVTTNLTTGVATGVSAGTVTITYTDPTGCVKTKGILINQQPGVLSGVTTVCAGNTTAITSALEGGTWSSSDGTVATVGTALGWSTAVSGLLPGTTSVTATNALGCTRSITVTVTAAAAAITGDGIVCPGGTIQLTNSATGGTWSSNATAKATVNATTGVVTGVAAGTVTITYMTSPTCFAVKQITVNGTPAGITGPAAVCMGAAVSLAHVEAGGTWVSSNPSRATVDAGTGEVTGISAGALTITYHINSGCSRTFAMVVNPVPAAIGGVSALCQGSTVTFTNTTTGGAWSSSNPSVASVPSTPGNVTGVSAGVATITYKLTATNCYATRDVTVNEQPTAIGGGPNKLCIGGVETYTSTPTGGTWASSLPARASVDATSGQMTGVSAGTITLSYNLSTGCYRTLAMTVNALPAAIGGTAAICQSSTTALTNTTTGGTWSSSAAGTASVTATGVVTGVSAGMAQITYKVTATGCQATRQVTVNELPSAISGPNQICISSNGSYTSTPTGGTWLSSAPTKATIGLTTGTAIGVSLGVTLLTYTAPVTGCRATKQITVNALPAAITGTTTICVGNSVMLTAGTAGQTWSSTMGTATVTSVTATTATLTGISAGTTIISYTNASGCAKTLAITVNDAVPAITGDMIVCPTRTIALSTTATGGTWSSSLTSRATVNSSGLVTGVNAGSVNISYITSPGCNAVANVTVNAAPAAITGPTSVCPMDMIDLNHATAGGTWSASNGNVSVNASNGEITGVTAGSSTISYSINSGCFVTSSVTVKVPPAAISGSLAVAAGATSALTNATTGGTWSSSNTDAATIGSTTGIMSGVGVGTSIITYRVTATQCYATGEATVTEPPAGRQMGTESTKNILIYPNPTTGVLTIDASSEGVFTLYTLDGKQLQQYRTEAPSTSVSIPNNLAAGVYMCRFEGTDGSTKIVRIVYNP